MDADDHRPLIRKILGSMVAALGAVATSLYAYAFTRAAHMADLAEVAGDDRAAWISHWQLSTGTYACLGLLLLIGGCLILARYPLGAIVAAVAVFLSGTVSWIASATGFSRFPFEAPNVVETVILIGLSGFLILLYLRRALWTRNS